MDVRSAGDTIGGSLNRSGGGGGGGFIPLLPDCAAALIANRAANMALRRIRRKVFRIAGLVDYRVVVAKILL